MGALNLMFCPHGMDESRVAKMNEFLLCNPGIVGVRIDNCALQIKNGKFRVYTQEGMKDTVAMKHYVKDGVIVKEDIQTLEWRDLDELFKVG